MWPGILPDTKVREPRALCKVLQETSHLSVLPGTSSHPGWISGQAAAHSGQRGAVDLRTGGQGLLGGGDSLLLSALLQSSFRLRREEGAS